MPWSKRRFRRPVGSVRATVAFAVPLAVFVMACDRDGQPTADGSSPPATASSPSESPASSAAAPASLPSASGANSGVPVAAKSAASPWSCGAEGQPPCPMQGWMKKVVARALAQGDFKALEKALRTIASKPVPGMDEWVTIATKGAEAAKAQDMAGARDSCKQCHQLYSDHYKKTMRDKPW